MSLLFPSPETADAHRRIPLTQLAGPSGQVGITSWKNLSASWTHIFIKVNHRRNLYLATSELQVKTKECCNCQFKPKWLSSANGLAIRSTLVDVISRGLSRGRYASLSCLPQRGAARRGPWVLGRRLRGLIVAGHQRQDRFGVQCLHYREDGRWPCRNLSSGGTSS